MRTYGKKFLHRKVTRTIGQRVETRNAILWDILDEDARTCRVKIQGSNELIVARYPGNKTVKPFWLTPGSAVRVLHVSGLRNHIEVIGDGGTIPTPVEGGSLGPTPELEDGIMSGCYVRPGATPNMCVTVGPGTFRIGEVLYYLNDPGMFPILMGDTSFVMGMGRVMGSSFEGIAATACVSAPAAGYFRYDVISVGTDGVVDVTTGTPSTGTPTMPDTPASQVKLAHLFLIGGMTEITNANINTYYQAPVPAYLDIEIADDELAWGESSTAVTLKAYDHYGNQIAATSYVFRCTIYQGNGTLSGGDGTDTDRTQTGLGTGNFTYTRGGVAGDSSPVLWCYMDWEGGTMWKTAHITLLDGSGNPMF